MPLTPGDILQDRYRIVALLGQGGMGAVYRAWDLRLKVSVALKEQIPQPGLDAALLTQLREQFEQEAVTLARLSHPHLVRVTDFFDEGGNAYLVMDFLEGENLAGRIAREGRLSESQVLTWARQLLDALAYCHAEGVVHRDIKPQNILLRPDGRAVLVDFGLVKLWNPNDPQTRTVMRGMGTPEYAPPEQYGKQGQTTDPRSDLYSLGATLYHALTGQAPPTASDRMADPQLFRPVRALNPVVSAATETAILRALEPARDARWPSAAEMLGALSSSIPPSALQQSSNPPAPAFTVPMPQPDRSPGRPVARSGESAPPPIGLAAAQPKPRRSKLPWILGSGVLLIAAVAFAAWLVPEFLVAPPAPTATRPAPTSTRLAQIATPAPPAAEPTRRPAPEPIATAGPLPQFPLLAGKPTIAVLAPLSGDVAIFGQSVHDGVLLAVAEWNAAGNGVDIVLADTQCDAGIAATTASEIIDKRGIAFIIGDVCSAASIPISELAATRGVLQISPTSTHPAVTLDQNGNTKPSVFRACFLDTFQGTIGASFAIHELKAQTAALLFDSDNVYSTGLAKYFGVTFESLGGKVLAWESYTAEVTDFRPILNQIATNNPDILYLPDYYSKVNGIAEQALEIGMKTIFMGGDGWDSADLNMAALDGGYFTNHFSPEDPRPEVQTFVQAYQAAYGTTPDALAALGYDSAHILLQAMAEAGTVSDPAAVARALESGAFNRVTGLITFDAQHNPVKHGVILRVENGAFRYVATLRPE